MSFRRAAEAPQTPLFPGPGHGGEQEERRGALGRLGRRGRSPRPFPRECGSRGAGSSARKFPAFGGLFFPFYFIFSLFFPIKGNLGLESCSFLPGARTDAVWPPRTSSNPRFFLPSLRCRRGSVPGGGARCPPASHGLPRGGRSAPGTENGDFSLCEPTEPLPAPSRGPSRGPRGEGEMPADAHPEPLPRGTPAVHPLPRMGLRPGA